MMRNIHSYATLIFDCDGVVLNSNAVKTEAFYQTAIEFGLDAAERLVEYHQCNGGVSRFKKFDYFLTNIIPNYEHAPSVDNLVDRYAGLVRHGLLSSEVESSLEMIKEVTSDSKWLIVSGGAQDELRWVFREKGIDKLFHGGIFGSPDSKEEILAREIERGNILEPAIYLGDSEYDHFASKKYDIDFVFISQWTEFAGYGDFCQSKGIAVCESLIDLLALSCE